ncbi:capsular polysaccharide biosynthesis protein [Thalassotalea sp. PS06]|uniref:capsular polysaccharide biosynthesis protein n=1 Tax=Thalassotalea sp. PS06 TaxID=2594005 RepID=UPI00116366A3|nr:capsular polysaccharide biosynthesis protein [Thalassotalea sp. PS06]QDP01938.1 capsular polysaccharide biosynthesis protein [Thalassotalea sp. PS06]
MTIYTSSKGLAKRKQLIEAVFGMPLEIFRSNKCLAGDDVFVGWGLKANTENVRKQASLAKAPFWALEDGFIGYTGHPSKSGIAVSIIKDVAGMYYDASQESDLENLIKARSYNGSTERAKPLIGAIIRNGVTKYNCYDSLALPPAIAQRLDAIKGKKILLIDQVAGDLSVQGALASDADFLTMLEAAKRDNPEATLILRAHPDTRLGKKKGILARQNLDNVMVISEACHPHALLGAVDEVYTVSSQMGFEALLLNKPVHCFGMPFYAGWGLTNDTKQCKRRNIKVSLEQLVSAALIDYPRYFNPISGKPCEVEEIVALIGTQLQRDAMSLSMQLQPRPKYSTIYLVGFSFWKRAFIKTFFKHHADKLKFVSRPVTQLNDGEQNAVWGNKYPELNCCIRIEDGFIRSSGLGSNLCRPSSLAIDFNGIYFNSTRPSDLEHSLNSYPFEAAHALRGEKLIELLNATGVSKYNVGSHEDFLPPQGKRKILLVVGQVEGDASLLTGSPRIQSNEQLLCSVREKNPDAFIIYKPHPDVVAGNRGGDISSECRNHCVDQEVSKLTLNKLFPHIDELHTMTSLSGFEALIRGVKVVTWGQPFYSGWGLTEDHCQPQRRERSISLAELVYATLVIYPRYIDWPTGLFSSPELAIAGLAEQGSTAINRDSFWQRIKTKCIYLWHTFN